MAIDWITVSAQIVNFLILVWLLKRFLYQPVIDAMDKREEKIADRLRNAEQREQVAETQRRDYQDQLRKLDADRERLMTEAEHQVEEEKHKFLEDARRGVDESRQQWQRQVHNEQQEFLQHWMREAAQSVQTIARKALTDLADRSLEEQIIEHFIEHLRGLDDNSRRELGELAKPLTISTMFPLNAHWRNRLTRTVHELLKEGIDVEYAETEDVICGITLTASGRRLSWNLNDYLEQLREPIQNALTMPVSLAERQEPMVGEK